MGLLTFSEAKARCILALREGNFEHEARDVQSQKNLLAVGKVDVEEAVALVLASRGPVKASPHHGDPNIQVWVFKPSGWYIKFYFLDKCMFISFHKEN